MNDKVEPSWGKEISLIDIDPLLGAFDRAKFECNNSVIGPLD